MVSGEVFNAPELSFEDVFSIKYPEGYKEEISLRFFWSKFTIEANINTDVVHFSDNIKILKNDRVRVWMVSRMGDFGITSNLGNPTGYDIRGIKAEELFNWSFYRINETSND